MILTFLAAAGMLGVLQRRATTPYSEGVSNRKQNNAIICFLSYKSYVFAFNTTHICHNK